MTDQTTISSPIPDDKVARGHTPGPWKVANSVENDFVGIYPDTGKMEFPIAKMPEVAYKSQAENARLIAAAPDLLNALKAVLPMLEAVRMQVGFGKTQEKRIEVAKAAIARASA